jgi:hypothetical protein
MVFALRRIAGPCDSQATTWCTYPLNSDLLPVWWLEIVFGDLSETEKCIIIVRVTKKDNSLQEQTYFGLNCVESFVLADGIKTSTFGFFHSIPAAWMKYASRLLGVKRASTLGDSIVQWLNKMKLL